MDKLNQRICFLISSLGNAGGTERVCTAIANKLAELNYPVTIISMYNAVPFFSLADGVRHISIAPEKKFSKLRVPVTLFRLRKVIRANASVLINVDSALFIYSGLATIGLKVKNVIWEHFHYKAKSDSFARALSRRLAAKYSDAVITLTNADKSEWLSRLQGKAKVVTINNPSPFVPDKTAITDREPIVLAVGRLNEQKGFDHLIDAWQIIKERNALPWVLYIVGSGELKNELEHKIASYNLSGSVYLIPATSDIKPYYRRAGIYCLSSRYEGFPMVLLEAQALGLPVVSYDCETGPAEIIQHNKTGMLVKNGDIQALAGAISNLINNTGKRLSMSAFAIENAAKFHIDHIITHWINLFSVL